jgi:hypothetical protein
MMSALCGVLAGVVAPGSVLIDDSPTVGKKKPSRGYAHLIGAALGIAALWALMLSL